MIKLTTNQKNIASVIVAIVVVAFMVLTGLKLSSNDPPVDPPEQPIREVIEEVLPELKETPEPGGGDG